MEAPIKILVCGGGNGAHTLTATASAKKNVSVNVMTLFADEAERWTKTMDPKGLHVEATKKDGSVVKFYGNPVCVTKDPAKAMDGVDAVFFVVPAFAHKQYFETISKYLKPNTIIVGMPGQAGFEIQAMACLKELTSHCAIVNLESMPWACRIEKFATEVKILGYKDSLTASLIKGKGNYKMPPLALVQRVLGELPKLKEAKNYLGVLLNCDSIVHPPLMYGQWKDWDGKPVKEAPLFYQGVDDVQADILSKVSAEVVETAQKLHELNNDLDMSDVDHLYQWYIDHYGDQITDSSSLKRCMNTNKAYDGLRHPVKAVEGGFEPDFKYRYMSEDIPFGYVIMKGIAECAGVKTPTMDMLIEWGQGILGKEYIVNGSLTGKNMNETRAPQAFGFTTVEDLCRNM